LHGDDCLSSWSIGKKTVNQFKAVPLIQENHSILSPALSENEDRVLIPRASVESLEAAAPTGAQDGHEPYERGMALKNAGLFRQAAEHFEKAAEDPAYRLKGFAQMGLCLKRSGKQEEAAAAFRRTLQVPSTSPKEQVQILYLLGRTLESLERIPEALETYRWLRREAPHYRDVAMRIVSLSAKRTRTGNRQEQGNRP
jgi:tetratricopeptide (TPR) repeat protein